MLSVVFSELHKLALYAECHYAECRYAECRGAVETHTLTCKFNAACVK
jgi:hypothetical protein